MQNLATETWPLSEAAVSVEDAAQNKRVEEGKCFAAMVAQSCTEGSKWMARERR